MDSFLERLEKRLCDLETSLQQVQQSQKTPLPNPKPPSRKEARGNQDAITWDGSGGSQASPALLYEPTAGIGEIDTAEDSIDGMGAIKFTDEEDWGYFGIMLPQGPPYVSNLISSKGRLPILPSYAIYLWLWLELEITAKHSLRRQIFLVKSLVA